MDDEMKIEKLGKDERNLLLKALDIDWTNLKCQYCNKKVYYTDCGIMPSVNTTQLATITCNSPLCICEFLEALESTKLKPCCKESIQKVFDDIDKEMVAEKPYGDLRKDIGLLKLRHLSPSADGTPNSRKTT